MMSQLTTGTANNLPLQFQEGEGYGQRGQNAALHRDKKPKAKEIWP